jgi:DNA polymerase
MANVLKCRPPGNRKPEKEEVDICRLYLKKQIEIISPKLLLLLGKTAVEGLYPDIAKESMDDLRIKSRNIGALTYMGIPIIITYHPAALIYKSERKFGALEDFKVIQNIMQELLLRDALLI